MTPHNTGIAAPSSRSKSKGWMFVESTKGGKRMSIPYYYSPVMLYMVVKDADGFIKFLKAVFNAEEKLIVRKPDDRSCTPNSP